MKINDNGKVREMTPAERAQVERIQAQKPEPTEVEILQEQVNELTLMLADIIGGAPYDIEA